jgi:tryptophanyl-tRNA synthetase
MRAVTDSGPTEPNQEKPQAIENLFNLMKALSEPETVQFFEDSYNACAVRYGDMKKQLAEDVVRFTTPFRERILDLLGNDDYLRKVVNMGRDKAHESAANTIKEVRAIIGFKSF